MYIILLFFPLIISIQSIYSTSHDQYHYILSNNAPYQILNKPHIKNIRGINYSPSPIGYSPDDLQSIDLYSTTYHTLHIRDLRIINQLGANVIRISHTHEELNHTAFFDLCHSYNVSIILTFDPAYGLSSKQFDINDERTIQLNSIVNRFKSQLIKYQHHPALLAYAIGNSPNRLSNTLSPAWYRLTHKLSHVRDELCINENNNNATQYNNNKLMHINKLPECWHPITIPLSDTVSGSGDSLISMILSLELQYPNSIDFYSFNLYRGNTFTSFFNDYRRFQILSGSNKPALISEFGMDILDFRIDHGELNQTLQSYSIQLQWSQINYSIEHYHSFLGGLIFEYSDEWYRTASYYYPKTVDCPITDPSVHGRLY